MEASISIYLDTRIKKPDNVYPVKLRATYNRERIYLGIDKSKVNSKFEHSQLEKFRYDGKGNYSIDQDIFNKAMDAKKSGIYKELQAVFRGIELDAQRKADSLMPFSFDGFRSVMNNTRSKKNFLFTQFDELITELKAADRIGTAISYNNASKSLRRFANDKDVPFEYWTVEKLEKYKVWMKTGDNPNSDTTIGIYTRALRTLFNRARREGITTHYPFGRDLFKIPKGKSRKIALNTPDLKSIFEYQLPEKHPYAFYVDMWKLMYLLGGINPTDLCHLKETNIQHSFVYYVRQKTIRTANETKEIKVPYLDQVISILDKWRVPVTKDSFLLPVIYEHMDATKRKTTIGQFVKMVNTAMKAVADELKIKKKPTTYVARHSISTQLLRAGASVKFIGDQLGHHDTKTTEAYLEGFEDEQIRATFNQATQF